MIISDLVEEIFSIESLNSLIFSRKLFEEALKEFDSLIEIDNIKEILLRQIRFFLVKMLRGEMQIVDKEFFNTVLYGPPGVGKSKIAKIISKVWKSLGIIKRVEGKSSVEVGREEFIEIKTIFEEFYENHFSKNKRSAEGDKKWNTLKQILESVPLSIEKENSSEIIICGREDFVAEYTGQTSVKTLAFLEKNVGKCIIVEEAYTLCYSSLDTYGIEALTLLNRWMDERRGENIFIFVGYKNLMLETIFKFQPGLKRRCRWFFDIRGYSPAALKNIFLLQLSEVGLIPSDEVKEELPSFFEKEKEKFPNFGGDTLKLSSECDTIHFSSLPFGDASNETLSLSEFKEAFSSFENFSVAT